METNFEKFYFKNTAGVPICCELVSKIKQYINILQFESNRLSSLQQECNQLLDTFYYLKEEYEFFLKEMLPVKYLGEKATTQGERYITEFSLFVKSIWQMGKLKFSERRQKAQYSCFVGVPLIEVTATVQSFVDEVMQRLAYMSFHPECASSLHIICSQIQIELRDDNLGTADACLRQLVYLQSAIPFLQELKGLINHYIMLPDVHTPKELVDNVILQTPCIKKYLFQEDCHEMIPFRFVVDLLNGKLVDYNILDHNSEIFPVVEDDMNLKRSTLVMKAVEWIMQQYKIKDVTKIQKTSVLPINSLDLIERKKSWYSDGVSPMYSHSPKAPNWSSHSDIIEIIEALDLMKFDWGAMSNCPFTGQRKINRRGRKSGVINNVINQGNDLQPIKLHTLQTPFLPPLL